MTNEEKQIRKFATAMVALTQVATYAVIAAVWAGKGYPFTTEQVTILLVAGILFLAFTSYCVWWMATPIDCDKRNKKQQKK